MPSIRASFVVMSKSRSTLISVISSKIREAQRGMWIEGINCLRAFLISIRLDMTLANKRHQQNKAIQNGYYGKSPPAPTNGRQLSRRDIQSTG